MGTSRRHADRRPGRRPDPQGRATGVPQRRGHHRRLARRGPARPAQTVKELRYLLEFFGGFYDPDTAEGLIGALKGLQDNLGEFQDSAVQHHAIDGFAEALLADGSAPAATLLALGRLGGALEERQHRARVDFADRFAAFAEPANRQRLAALSGAGS